MKKVRKFLDREQNLLIHIFIAIIVIIVSIYFRLNSFEWMCIIFAIGLVISAELLNSAIELTVDTFTKKFNELAMVAKDTAAAAVVIAAINSVIIGLYVFLPKIIELFTK